MLKFLQLVRNCLTDIKEIMPWDLQERLEKNPELLILDVREPREYAAMHIEGSISIPRGILESACEWDYEETIPELVQAREREIVVVCRSGFRSVLASHSMKLLGFQYAVSLKTGLRGWNDYDQPLVNQEGQQMGLEEADEYFTANLRPDQLKPETA